MTLQRRLLLLLLLSALLVWIAGGLVGLFHARAEINELFDTQQVLLARQVLSMLPSASSGGVTGGAAVPAAPAASAPAGDADLADLSIAVWDRQGRLMLGDQEAVLLPVRPDAQGFVDLKLAAEGWRVYYVGADDGEWRVAVGQKQEERDELVWTLMASQLVPWVLTLPVLLLVMAGAVRQALKPVRVLTEAIEQRAPSDLQPLVAADLPTDLQPLLQAMNSLLAGIAESRARERRFIADAAHELRTPLAALQAQWDALRLQPGAPFDPASATSRASQDKIAEGLARMGRLVAQLLTLSRLDHADPPGGAGEAVDWQAMVERLFSELLPLADRAHVELECQWPPAGIAPLALRGNQELTAAMLRNLLDNAIRHSGAGQIVRLQLSADAIEVQDDGPGVDEEHLARLGEPFFRPQGQDHSGSGLGLSIVRRIASLHGLQVHWANRQAAAGERCGFVVRLTRLPSVAAASRPA